MKRNSALMAVLLALVILLNACAPAAAPATNPAPESTATVVPTASVTATTAAPPTVTATAVATATTAAPTATPAAASNSGAFDISSIKDADGNTVKLDKPAEKIISLAPSNTEVLFAVGAGKQVIAREDFTNFPEEAKALPSVGGNTGKYNLEQITKLQSDLILASPLTAPEQIKSIKDINPNVFVLPNPTDLEGMYANLITVGELTGHKADAEKLVQDLRARAKAVLDKVAGATSKPKVFYELDATDPSKPWTSGAGTFIDTLITMAGGQNVGASLKGSYAQISQEELIVQNPDVILLGDALYGGITADQVAKRPGWNVVNAVKNNQVLPFNDDLVSRPGPRLVDGLEALARAIHPELFK